MNRDKIKAIMAQVFKLSVEEVADDASQQTLSAWDSLAHLNLIVALETDFDISFEPEEIAEMTSLPKVETALAAKL